MALDLKLLARLRAYQLGRAQRYATNIKVAIQSHALVVAPIAMAGEDTTIHAVACGRLGDAPVVMTVPDPRLRDDQYRLFEDLGELVQAYFDDCHKAGDYPQIIVSSSAAVGHLSTLADRLRFNKDNARVRRFGELITYVTDRHPYAGQQALITATEALRLHFATGQDEGEDEHLLALLTWIAPPANRNVLAAVAVAELVPMGVKTNPEFDKSMLAPLVGAYNEARRAGASPVELSRRADLIRRQLEPVVTRIYQATRRAITLLASLGLPPLSDLSDLECRERSEFENFMLSRSAGFHIPLKDSPKRAAFGIAAREDAVENYESASLLGDGVKRAQARLDGRILVGVVETPRREKLGPRRFAYRFNLRSVQRSLHCRVRDELCLVADPRLRVVVTEIHRDEFGVLISLEVNSGQRAVGLPESGEQIELVDQVPDWDRLQQGRMFLKARLAETPWTHLGGEIPSARPERHPVPPDLLAAVERLRTR